MALTSHDIEHQILRPLLLGKSKSLSYEVCYRTIYLKCIHKGAEPPIFVLDRATGKIKRRGYVVVEEAATNALIWFNQHRAPPRRASAPCSPNAPNSDFRTTDEELVRRLKCMNDVCLYYDKTASIHGTQSTTALIKQIVGVVLE